MSDFMNFLREYESVIDFLQALIFIIISLMLYRKTGNIKYLQGAIDNMNYQKGSYFLTENVDEKTGEVVKTENPSLKFSQSFNSLVPIYRLNKVTNELEKTDEFVDIQEQINSLKEQALESMLDRFMPKLVDETADYTNVKGDLDMLTESFAVAEEYREKFNLGDNVTIQDIFQYVDNYSKELKKKLETKTQVVEEIKQGVQGNEKENVKESE